MTHFYASFLMPAPGSSRRPIRFGNWLVWFMLIGLGLGLCPAVRAQNFVWAKNTGNSYCYAVTVDGSGNVYTTGYFQGTVDFDPGPGVVNLTSTGTVDIFVCKFNAAGALSWAKGLVGSSGDGGGTSVAVDGSGNVYTTGDFSGTVDFDPGSGVVNLTSMKYADIFVSKLNSAGNFVWAKAMGGPDYDRGYSVAVDGSGNVLIAGAFANTVDFDPGPGVYNLSGYVNDPDAASNGFVSKLDGSGNFVWAKQMGGQNHSGVIINSLALDGSGNVFTTGSFGGTVDFNPGSGVVNLTAGASGNSTDGFIHKLDGSGNFVWVKQIIGNTDLASTAIALDGSGNVYTTGYFARTADFDPGPGVYSLTGAGINSQIYVSKLDGSGNFVWAKQMGSTGTEAAFGLAVDGSGNVYTTGVFDSTVDFDPGPGVYNLVSAGGYDLFVSKFDTGGNFGWARRIGSSYEQDRGLSVAVDKSGTVYTTGVFSETADFDPGPNVYNLTALSNETSQDMFISKLNQLDIIAPLNSVCAGSPVALSATVSGGTSPYSYTWVAPAGGTLSATNTAAVSATLTGVGVQTFTLSVAGSGGPLTSSTVSVTVNATPATVIAANPSLTIAQGTSTTLTVPGASSYNWSSGQSTSAISVSVAGTYSVTGTIGSCSAVASATVKTYVCGAILYVTPTGAGSQNGDSWANAASGADLQTVINLAAGCGGQVWVASGTYKPTTTNRTISFTLKNGVAIYGGFTGTESSLSQRPGVNPSTGSGGASQPSSSTLSGDIGPLSDNTDNSYHVIYNPSGLNATARLDGFVITGGNASVNDVGGGMYNSGSSPTVTNCFFVTNSARFGGGMYNLNSSPVVTNCAFRTNSGFQGGGLFNQSSNPTVSNCLFAANSTTAGGGLYNYNSSPTLINCSFQGNLASTTGGALESFALQGNAAPILTNCSFQNNSAANVGSTIYGSGFQGTASVTLINCVVYGNADANAIVNGGGSSVTASYTLFDSRVTGYTGSNNLTTSVTPFASTTGTQLAAGSAAINAGNPASTTTTVGTSVDLAGNPRVAGGRIDMGAYESVSCSGPILTLKAGSWDDATVWSCNVVPVLTDVVQLNHVVTLPVSYVAQVKTLRYGAGGKLTYQTGAKLRLGF